MEFIDSHTHLYQPAFDGDRSAAMERCAQAGVRRLLLPNIDRVSMERVHGMMDAWPDRCWGMVGLHPCHVKADWEEELAGLREVLAGAEAAGRRYVAVGEIGFDLYWEQETLPLQRLAFREQVAWAKAWDLPVVIHVRDAFEALFEEMDRVCDDRLRGVVHCFTGNVDQTRQILSYGDWSLGIGGVVTYKNGGLDAVLPEVPHDRVLLETDSPYLAPVPFRGKRNESSYVPYVAGRLAEIWGVSVEEVAEVTTRNTERLFRLPAIPQSPR
jgi:TatD DNase family protein